MPVRFLFLDEVDGYPGDAGGEGDPVALAMQRAVTFVNRKVLMVSTPTVKGFSRIEAAYEESDKRVFAVPCDHCGAFSQVFWRDIRWPEGKFQEAAWHCPHCGGAHPEYRKPALLAHGHWQATAAGDGKTAGFHLSSLYSPWATWAEIAEEHRDAKDDPVRLKVWVNTKLAETWEERDGERPDGTLDPSVGVSKVMKVGVQIKQCEPLMMIHYNDEHNLEAGLEYLRSAYRLAPKRPSAGELILERIA